MNLLMNLINDYNSKSTFCKMPFKNEKLERIALVYNVYQNKFNKKQK